MPLHKAVVVVPGPTKRDRAPLTALEVDVMAAPPSSSSAARSPSPGMPTPILAAALRYGQWVAKLRERGLSAKEADALILEVSRDEGGVALLGETINLTVWSERTHIPRPILEALVLSAHRREYVRPPVLPLPAVVMVEEAASEPWTPAPPATRMPSGPPSSSASL